MTPEEATQVADEALLAHTGSRLTHIQRMILCESLAGKGYEQMVGYDAQHIKNEGSDLWQLLSQALGEKVSKKNFKGALEKRLKLGDIVPKPPMPSSYNQQTWVGRESLISDLLPQLLPKLQGQTRLLWITGISGIGKTTLGECLAVKAWEIDPAFQWIYLEVLQGQSPDFPSVAADLLARLGDRDLDPQERNNPDQLARRLLQKLQSHPYWIQLDALERLLKPEHSTEFVDPYWATFLQRCLTEPAFTSRLVLTSQAFPNALVELDDRYSNVWAEIRLEGLLQVEQQLEFFAKRGIAVDAANQDILARIAKIYEGHPLVLKVIAEDILDPKEFAGDVARYWQVNQPEFEQVARELQTARLDETAYNEALDRKVRDRIKKSLEQLPTDALDLLCRSAVFRRPVPKKFWLAMIGDRSSKQQKSAYRTLDDRALVEQEGIHQNQRLIRQHNLIRDIAYDLLRQDSVTWETAERQAAELWLTAYKPDPNLPNLEKVRGYLEAFEHYFEIKDYQTAYEIPKQSLKTNNAVHRQLLIWGYFRELIPLHNKLLFIAREIDDRQGECIAFGNLGIAYYFLCQYHQAIDYHQKALVISREIGDRRKEGAALGNLGTVYDSLGNYEQAIEVYQQHLAIAREIGDRREEGKAIGNLGVAYKNMGNHEQVIKHHQQHLAIARDIGDRSGEGDALGNLGVAYDSIGKHEQAIEVYQQCLTIAREIGNRWTEGAVLGNIGIAYNDLGNYEKANEHHQQYLTIAREIGYRQGEGIALSNLGYTLIKLNQYSDALERLHPSLEIFREIDDRANEAEALLRLAQLHQKTGSIDLAKQYCDRALALAIELGIPLAEECEELKAQLENEP